MKIVIQKSIDGMAFHQKIRFAKSWKLANKNYVLYIKHFLFFVQQAYYTIFFLTITHNNKKTTKKNTHVVYTKSLELIS